MKTIKITEPLENAIYDFCTDELEWHTTQLLSIDYGFVSDVKEAIA